MPEPGPGVCERRSRPRGQPDDRGGRALVARAAGRRGALERILGQADEWIIAAMNEHTLPGLGVGIVHGGESVYARGFGLAEIERETPVTPKTVFRVGSITKTMTAIGLMQLWEQGKFDLEDPVDDYLGSCRIEQPDSTAAPPITFRHLLTHTSGVRELRKVTDLFRPMIGFGAKPDGPVPTCAEYYAGGLRPTIYPGTKWAYSNHGFNVLGQLVEDISGEPLADYMRNNVFDPLGMKSTDYLRSERVREGLAQGYRFSRGRLQPVKYMELVVRGAGSVFSTVEDMCRYAAALLRGGANEHGRVLEPGTLGLMMEPHYRLDERLPSMGLAFVLDRFDRHRVAGHDGGLPGFVSSMLLAPDDDVGVVAFANTSFVSAWSVTPHNIADDLLRRMLDVPDPHSRLPRRDVLESRHLWPELCGFYGSERGLNTNARIWLMYAGEIEVFVKGKHLAMRTLVGPLRKGVRLYPIDAEDPLAFEAIYEGQAYRVIFERDVEADRVDRLCICFDRLRKRRKIQSLRVGTMAGLGVTAGAALAGWRRLKGSYH